MQQHFGESHAFHYGHTDSEETEDDLHTQTRNVLKLHECAACGLRFSRSSSLESHLKNHSNEKPFKCKVCSLKFDRYDEVKIHMEVHRDNKYKCPSCDARFIEHIFLRHTWP